MWEKVFELGHLPPGYGQLCWFASAESAPVPSGQLAVLGPVLGPPVNCVAGERCFVALQGQWPPQSFLAVERDGCPELPHFEWHADFPESGLLTLLEGLPAGIFSVCWSRDNVTRPVIAAVVVSRGPEEMSAQCSRGQPCDVHRHVYGLRQERVSVCNSTEPRLYDQAPEPTPFGQN